MTCWKMSLRVRSVGLPRERVRIPPDHAFDWEICAYHKDEKLLYALNPWDQLEGNVQRVFVEYDFYLKALLDPDRIQNPQNLVPCMSKVQPSGIVEMRRTGDGTAACYAANLWPSLP